MKQIQVTCPGCGTDWESADSRPRCPQCGLRADANDAREKRNKPSGCGGCAALVAVGVIASIVIVALMSPSENTPAPVAQPQPVNGRQNEPTRQSVPIAPENQPGLDSEEVPIQDKTGLRYIPGLAAVDVYGIFTSRGFSLAQDFGDASNKIWRCTTEQHEQNRMTVEVFGSSDTRITWIRAIYVNISGDNRSAVTTAGSKPFLTELGNILYEGSDTHRAPRWINGNVGNTKTTTIGDVSFKLIANPRVPRVRMLLIRPSSVDTDVLDNNDPKQAAVFREKKASSKVEMAKLLFNDKDNLVARKRLQQVIDDYPETEAATEARKLLDQL